MSGWIAAVLGMAAVINPIGVGRAAAWGDRSHPSWRRETSEIVVFSTMVFVAMGLLTAPILELLDLSTPTFRLAVAVVMGVTGGVWLVRPTPPLASLVDTESKRVVGLTLLITPGPVFAAMAANGDGGTLAGLIAVVIAIALVSVGLVTPRLKDPMAVWAVRMTGAATIVIAVGIGIDSARTV